MLGEQRCEMMHEYVAKIEEKNDWNLRALVNAHWSVGHGSKPSPPPPPPPWGNFRPILDRSISYPNPKLTCYAKIQCRLQELWPLESHSVKKTNWWRGGDFFFS